MKFWKSTQNQRNTEDLLKEVNSSKREELELLLLQIQNEIDQSQDENKDLLSVKTMITSRLASRRSK
jgi:hypothetical protein